MSSPKTLTADMFIADRFWEKVAPSNENGCRLWTGAAHVSGYGSCYQKNDGPRSRAHRAAYALVHGRTPSRMCVMHRCDVKLCVNPDHLVAATHRENMVDMSRKGKIHNAKFDFVLAEMVREVYARGFTTYREIGRAFGIKRRAVGEIVRREVYNHGVIR